METISNFASYAYSFVPAIRSTSTVTANLGNANIGLTTDSSQNQGYKPIYKYEPTALSAKELALFGLLLEAVSNESEEDEVSKPAFKSLEEAILASTTTGYPLEVELIQGLVKRQRDFTTVLQKEMAKLPMDANDIRDSYKNACFYSNQLARQMAFYSTKYSLTENDIVEFIKLFKTTDYQHLSEEVKNLEGLNKSVIHGPNYKLTMELIVNALGRDSFLSKVASNEIKTLK
jgi:hypothetical protein